jgi:hypothetical protein
MFRNRNSCTFGLFFRKLKLIEQDGNARSAFKLGSQASPQGRFTYLFELGCWICQACGIQTGFALRGPQPTTPTLPAKRAPATGSPRS